VQHGDLGQPDVGTVPASVVASRLDRLRLTQDVGEQGGQLVAPALVEFHEHPVDVRRGRVEFAGGASSGGLLDDARKRLAGDAAPRSRVTPTVTAGHANRSAEGTPHSASHPVQPRS
jgi:hypothetical protein